ncbi:MAG TPA: hypothetical protein PKM57_14495 [Kiritimatiellia bacterium]|nr:hypothetical protein [Kiritimatiellia bacterium]HPS06935.1 hypothetical protein [Kiritimatiellia bacterium]
MTNTLTPKQLKLVASLAADDDVQAACATAGVGRTTAYRWLKDPEVQSALAQHREQAFSEALGSLKSKASRAVAELEKLLTVSDERLRRLVCNDILLYAWRVRELEDFERRLVALEKRAEIRGHRSEADGEANENKR